MNNTTSADKFEKQCTKLLKQWKENKHHPFVCGVLSQLKSQNIDKRRIKDAHWVGKNGSLRSLLNQDPKGNPSDIVLEMKNGDFFGISLKQKESGRCITYKNPGLGAIGNYLGHDYSFFHEHHEKLVVDHFGLPLNQKNRVVLLKEDLDLKKQVNIFGDIMLQILLTHPEWGLKVKYESMPHKSNVDHILSMWMNAKNPVIPYMVVTKRGNDWNFVDPMKSKRREALLNSKKLYWDVSGNSLTVNLKTLNIMAMRIKYTSHKFASSIKFAGEFT